jgi:polyphosphate kinase
MAKKNKQHHREAGADSSPKLKRKEYEGEMRRLHGELVAMQQWVKASGAKIRVVFEGRDTAGKGGTIKRITERVSTRVFRVVALPAPTERFLALAPLFEKAMVDSGILLLKYWLEVSPTEQTRRLERRINDPRKVWKLSDMDLRSYSRWYDYSRARDAMFAATDTAWAPWYIARTDDKKRPAQHHQPPAQPGPLQAARAQGHHPAQAPARPRLRGTRPPLAVHPDTVLS